jgi:hypothetical protein
VSIFLLHDHLNKVVANTSPEIFAGNLYHIFTPHLSPPYLFLDCIKFHSLRSIYAEPAAGCRGTSHDHWIWVCLDLRQQQPNYCMLVLKLLQYYLVSKFCIYIYSDYIEKGIQSSDK